MSNDSGKFGNLANTPVNICGAAVAAGDPDGAHAKPFGSEQIVRAVFNHDAAGRA